MYFMQSAGWVSDTSDSSLALQEREYYLNSKILPVEPRLSSQTQLIAPILALAKIQHQDAECNPNFSTQSSAIVVILAVNFYATFGVTRTPAARSLPARKATRRLCHGALSILVLDLQKKAKQVSACIAAEIALLFES